MVSDMDTDTTDTTDTTSGPDSHTGLTLDEESPWFQGQGSSEEPAVETRESDSRPGSHPGPGATKPTGSPQPTARRPSTRSIVDVALAVNALSSVERAILTEATPSKVDPTNVAQLAVAAVEQRAVITKTLSSLLEVSRADPVEAGIVAISLDEDSDKKLFGRVWAVLAQLDVELGSSPPHSTARAGLALAVAAQRLDAKAEATIKRVSSAVRGG
jgi:hypothetical protein